MLCADLPPILWGRLLYGEVAYPRIASYARRGAYALNVYSDARETPPMLSLYLSGLSHRFEIKI